MFRFYLVQRFGWDNFFLVLLTNFVVYHLICNTILFFNSRCERDTAWTFSERRLRDACAVRYGLVMRSLTRRASVVLSPPERSWGSYRIPSSTYRTSWISWTWRVATTTITTITTRPPQVAPEALRLRLLMVSIQR